MLVENIMVLMGRSPTLMRATLELLALRGPVVPMRGNNLFVLSHAAVREVLERPRDFITSKVYTQRIKIEGGPCLLGVDPSPQYERELGALWRALANSDVYASTN